MHACLYSGRYSTKMVRDHLGCCGLAPERQTANSNDAVREMHALTVSRVERQNPTLSVPNFVVGNWVWLHNSASTVRQGAKAGTDAKVLKTKFRARLNGPLQDPCRRPLPLPL